MDRNSIFDLTKRKIGGIVSEDVTAFDEEILSDINTVIAVLTQIGIGPEEGFEVTGSTETWTDFLPADDPRFNMVKSYIPLKVKMMFDLTGMTSAVIEANRAIIAELEWRLNIQAEYPAYERFFREG